MLVRFAPVRGTTLEPFAVETTALGFGCAALLRDPSRKRRQALLAEAFDRGIRHFDVARMYGLGAAEEELGRFAQGRRAELIIASKYGIHPPAGSAILARFQGPGRWMLKKLPQLRSRARRGAESASAQRSYDPKVAAASLRTSLRRLRTDYLDILFLHEPRIHDVGDAEAIVTFLESTRNEGLIRAWGVSGEPADASAVLQRLGGAGLLQVHDDVLTRDPAGVPARHYAQAMTYGVLSSAIPAIVRHLSTDDGRRSRWRQATGVECADPVSLAPLLLREARSANPDGLMIVGTTRIDRVSVAVDAAETYRPDDAQVRTLQKLIRTELGSLAQYSVS